MSGFTFTLLSIQNWTIAILSILGLYGSFAAFFLFMRKNRLDIDKPTIRAKIGNLYEGLEPKGLDGTIYYIEYHSLIYFLRRAAFVVLTLTLKAYPAQ